MSFADRTKQASSPHEAVVILAEALDGLYALLSRSQDDGWGSWGGGDSAKAPTLEPSSPQPTPFEEDLETREAFAKRDIPVDPDAVAAAEAAVVEAESAFEAARLNGNVDQDVVDRMKQAQAKLRLEKDPGSVLEDTYMLEPDALRYEDLGADGHVVDLPPADEHRKVLRRQLAERIDLPGFFPAIMRGTEAQRQEIIETYVKGGPLWLSANRDIMAALPPAAKQIMVHDVMMDSNRLGYDFGRDVLKTEDVEGATLAIAQDNIDGIVDRGGSPYEGR